MNTKPALYKILFLLILIFTSRSVTAQNNQNETPALFNRDFNVYIFNEIFSVNDTVKFRLSAGWDKNPGLFNIRIYKIHNPEEFYIAQKSLVSWSAVGADSSNLYSCLTLVKSIDTVLGYKTVKNWKNEEIYFIDEDINFIPNENGAYFAKISHLKKSAHLGFWVTDMALVTQLSSNYMLCFAVNRFTGDIIDSVQLNYFLNRDKILQYECLNGVYNYKFTPENVKYLTKNKYEKPVIIAYKDKDVIVSNPHEYFYFKSTDIFKPYIYTNQPVYKPGSIVEFSGTIRQIADTGYVNFPEQDVLCLIKDSKNSEIYRQVLKTNSNGSFSGNCFIEENAPVGTYTIYITIDKDTSGNIVTNNAKTYSAAFTVKEFKNPEYYVKMTTDKEQYSTGEVLTGEISANYYFGNPVQDAEVEYEIFKKPLYRPWWYFSAYRWYYEGFYSGVMGIYEHPEMIHDNSGKLDKNGKFEFNYSIEEQFKYKNKPYYISADETDYMYIVNYLVTDKSRRTISGTKTFTVTRAEFTVSSSTDKYCYKPGDLAGIEVRTLDFTDKPVTSPFSVTVNKITYVKKGKENKQKFTFITSISGKTYLPQGKGQVHFTPAEEGQYEIEITAFDKNGKKITDKTSIYVYNKNSYWWSKNVSGTIQIIPEKLEYKTGETCRLLVVTPIPDATLLITYYNSYRIDGFFVKISGYSDYIDIPVLDSYCPNFKVQVSFVNNKTLYQKQHDVIAISEKKFLNLDISSDKPTYKPREEGVITLKVTDNEGQPVKNAEVSLGMVDESIYSVVAEKTPDIKQHFYSASKIASKNSLYGDYTYNVYSSAFYSTIYEMFNYKLYSAEELGTIRGRILTDAGNWISSALVIVNNNYLAAITSGDGTFEFKIPDGHYTLSIVLKNADIEGYIDVYSNKKQSNYYELKTDYITLNSVNNDKQGNIDIKEYKDIQPKSINAKGTIAGRVLDAKDKTPLVGAIVKIEGTSVGAETDASGDFIITNLKTGTYDLVCTYVGYNSSKMAGVKVKNNEVTKVSFEMMAGTVVTDTLMIVAERKGIDVEQSGRIITEQEIENMGIRGIQNISAKTSGVISDDKLQELFVEAETRTEFKDAMYWTPSVFTDENGTAVIKIKFPDNLTTWRITARVITDDTKVTQGVNNVISRKDLIIRMETPMFFQKDDELVISAIVHNYLNEGKNTKVSLKAENLVIENQTNTEQVIWLDKNEEKRIDWKVKVTEPVGTAKLNASALTNEESDALEYKVNLQPRGLKEFEYRNASFLEPYKTETFEFEIPQKTDLRTAKIMVKIVPSVISSMRNAINDLLDYPYGCIEQTLSRFIPALMVSKVYKDINAPEDEFFEKKLDKIVKVGFNRVYSMQKSDGSWGWWYNDNSDLFMTAHALYCLSLAKSCGYKVDSMSYEMGAKYVSNRLKDDKIDPSLIAFCLFSVSSSQKLKPEFFNEQFLKLEGAKLNAYSAALASLTAAKLNENNRQHEFTETLLKLVSYDDNGAFFGKTGKNTIWSDDIIQSTAFALKAIIKDSAAYNENKTLAESIINRLMKMKTGFGWGSTQQTAFVIYALTDYAAISKETEPDYVFSVYSANNNIGEKHITREHVFSKEEIIEIPAEYLKSGKNEIRFEKKGIGNAYINAELTYFSTEKDLQADDNGFEITRKYYKLEKYKDYSENVITYKKRPFTGVVTSGDEILVKIRVTSKTVNPQYFMLEDPIPAGCTNVEEEWAFNIEDEKEYNGINYNYWNWWYAQKEVRANRIAFFATYISGDEFELSYILRAQIPGKYNVSPTTGCLMYYPEIKGTGEEMKIEIKDK